MRVLLVGAGGAVGLRLLPELRARGHEVVALTQTAGKAEKLRELGAEPVVADVLDREAAIETVVRSRSEVIVHQATSLAGARSFKRFDREFALTNRLRTAGTANLLEGARRAGSLRRFVAQSYGNWNYERSGRELKTEDDPFDPAPPANQKKSLEAIVQLERSVLSAEGGVEGVVLRYGNFYGPGTGFASDGQITRQLRKRRLPIIGDGAGIWSFIHVDDVASATAAALERGAPGVYNIVDDEPAPVSEWLPELARAVGARPPLRVPVWLGRLAAGEVGVSMMTQIRGTSNAKAKRTLDWEPRYRSYREGFRAGLGDG